MMHKIIVSADVHGSYDSWLTLKALLNPEDTLVIAGDLFDTRYGSYSDPDFSPEAIKKDLNAFNHPFYYVYGNCDVRSFLPGFDHSCSFSFQNKKILVHHGHKKIKIPPSCDIIIQGHTHTASLIQKEQILMNPGSITCPRNNIVSYGVIDQHGAALIELKTGSTLHRIDF